MVCQSGLIEAKHGFAFQVLLGFDWHIVGSAVIC